ncbi:hypothetical protein CCP3SC15_1960003 [Gammaproteobacteria bacterium]
MYRGRQEHRFRDIRGGMMSGDIKFLRFCAFTLSHCFKGETCPKWRAEVSGSEYCGDKDMMIEKYKCTRFQRKKVPNA